MKRKILLIVSAVFIIAATVVAQENFKKYDMKSGIVTYEVVTKMGNFKMESKEIVYFDEYGMKECKETYTNNKLKESFFSDGKDLYTVKFNQKTAYKRGSAYRGTELRVEYSEFGTENDRNSGMVKKIPSMKVADKTCEMIEVNDGKGTVTKYGGWNKILLLMDTKTKDMQTIMRAVKVEENAKVPQEKFKVPSGYKVE